MSSIVGSPFTFTVGLWRTEGGRGEMTQPPPPEARVSLPLTLPLSARRTANPADLIPRGPAGDLSLPGLLGNWVLGVGRAPAERNAPVRLSSACATVGDGTRALGSASVTAWLCHSRTESGLPCCPLFPQGSGQGTHACAHTWPSCPNPPSSECSLPFLL